MNLLLKDHPLADLLALVRLAHVIGLDDLDEFLFAIHKDAASFIDIVGHPLRIKPIKRPV
jgi:hypothetical protein